MAYFNSAPVRRSIASIFALWWLFCGGLAVAGRLPDSLDAMPLEHLESERLPWSIKDIVEVRRVTDIAISARKSQTAFVVKQSFVDTGEIRYGLYVMALHSHRAFKIAEAPYLDQVAWHPGSDVWTARGDFGSGIQLYDIDLSGHEHPLVVNTDTVVVGSGDSVVDVDSSEGPRATGIASFEWSLDGKTLWYSTYRLRSAVERAAMASQGITFDDREMFVRSFFHDPTLILGAELHVLHPARADDRMILFVPGGSRVGTMFSRKRGSASWEGDSRHIQYFLWLSKKDGSVDLSRWSIDAQSGIAKQLPVSSFHDLTQSIASPDREGYLTVRLTESGRRFLEVNQGGETVKDFGLVDFSEVGSASKSPTRATGDRRTYILSVRYNDRYGLVTIPASSVGRKLAEIPESLKYCSFTTDVSYAVCVRESQTKPPEIVEVSMSTGKVTTAIVVNSRYARLDQLRVERREWVNRFGNVADGYVTYPRDYSFGHSYPTIVITHARDAINQFAADDFQWEFPVQVLAERGYAVLLVNEPRTSPKSLSAGEARVGIESGQTVTDMQFNEAFNPVATMEAALNTAIDDGLADSQRTGIAGYSRGAYIVEWAMTQSKLFHAAVTGDAGGFEAGHYGLAQPTLRSYYRQLYGGSPYDSDNLDNHRRLSVSYRAAEFSGPLLQLFTNTSGFTALELHSLLRDAAIPTEFVFFPGENHIFWEPRHRSAAMQRTIDWFDYWLRGERNDIRENPERYAQWDVMASAWQNAREKNLSPGL
jgi:dipeptidyl aminopeptidase/acylaminoacyl peptidase